MSRRAHSCPPPLIPLSAATDVRSCGAKAAALARLVAAGLPVPDGLVVPAHLPDGDLDAAARAAAIRFTPDAPYGLIARSSAPDEDGPVRSHAGAYASVFTPARDLASALRRVRASASAAANPQQDRSRGLGPAHGGQEPIAVLIQPALRPLAAGVLAATGHDDGWWRIEAARGLASPLTDGSCTGELHDSRHLHHNQRHGQQPGQPGSQSGGRPARHADQDVIVIPGTETELGEPPGEWTQLATPSEPTPAKIATSGDGLLHLHVPATWDRQTIITGPVRDQIVALGRSAARVLGLTAIDLEWAITPDGALHVVQARPLTTDLTALPPARTGTTGIAMPGGTRCWRGIPAAPGTATGPALHLAGGDLAMHIRASAATGAVLICGNLGPEAAQALLAKPAAIVSNYGGPLSHAAIVARELNIPCVTAVPSTDYIPDGTLLTIDGTTATITIPTTAPSPTHATGDGGHAAIHGQDNDTVLLAARLPDPFTERPETVILLHLPGEPLDLAPLNDGAAAGVFQPTTQPAFPCTPATHHDHLIPAIGRLMWPKKTPLPARIITRATDRTVQYQQNLPAREVG